MLRFPVILLWTPLALVASWVWVAPAAPQDSLRSQAAAPADTLHAPAAPPAAAPADTLHAQAAPGPADSVKPQTSPPPPPPPAPAAPLFNESGGWTLEAEKMLGEEDVGGRRHILQNVTITQNSLRITAPRGYYYPALNMTSLGGGVRLVNKTLTVTADSAAYFREAQLLQGVGGVKVTDRELRLAGRNGTYDRRNDIVTLDIDVSGEHQGRRINGDRLSYDRKVEKVDVAGNAVVNDPAHNSVVRGRRILYDVRTGMATLGERPHLQWRKGADEVEIEGDRMHFEDGGNRFHVAGNVMARQGRQTASSDSAYFLDREARGYLFGHPRVTDPEGDLAGDSLSLNFENGVLSRAAMKGHAVLVYVPSDPDLAGERSVIKGDSLVIFFRNNTIESLQAFGSPSLEYRPSKADSASGTGRVAARADTVKVIIVDQSVERVELAGSSSGDYFYHPGGSDSLDSVTYAADRITFYIPDQEIALRGSGQTDYHELTLKAEKIDFNARTETLVASPRPVLIDKTRPAEQEVVGERVTYDLTSTRGTIYHGRTQYEDGYIYADSLRKVTESEFNANSGQYTTCDLMGRDLEPHYHFTSGKMKIYLGDKVVAKPVVLYIGKIPIFALPFYVFSIRKGRHSGLLLPRFEFGFTGSGDRFFDNLGYYWAASDYTDYLFKLSYRENPGALIGETTARYAKTGLLNGQIDLTHVWGLDRGLNQVRLRHAQTFSEDFKLSADGEFGDTDIRSLRKDIGTRVDRQLRSNGGVTRTWRSLGLSLNALASRTLIEDAIDVPASDTTGIQEQHFENLDATFPRLSLSLTTKRLGHAKSERRSAFLPWASSLTYNLSFSGVHSLTRRTLVTTDSSGAKERQEVSENFSTSGAWSSQIRDNRKLFGFIDFAPFVNLRENWVDREFSATDTVKAFRRAATYSLNLSTGTTAYGTFFPRIWGLEAIRHTMNPSVTLSYNPEFRNLTYTDTLGIRRNRFPGVGGVASQQLNYSLDNRFQAKVKSGEDVKRIDLFSWNLSGTYDILAASKGALHPASNISNAITINRIRSLDLNFSSSHNPYHQLRMDQFNLRSGIRFAGKLPGSPAQEVETSAPVGPESSAPSVGFSSETSLYDTGRESDRGRESDALNWRTSIGFSLQGFRENLDSGGIGIFSLTGPDGLVPWKATAADGTSSRLNTTATLTGSLDVNLTRNWAMNYSNSYSFKTDEFTYQRVELRRDLHCWQAVFTYNATPLNQEFYFRIGVKALPDIKFESGPGFGALETLNSFAPGGSGF